jgi:radical SAM protein with 4Fe4S-binding SPASM domain
MYCYNVWCDDAKGKPSGYPLGELNTKDTLTLLNKVFQEIDCKHITLSGGEPLMRTDLWQILDFLSERDVYITLISNGHLLTEETVVSLLERGVDLFELPLLSNESKIHDGLSGATGAFDAVLSAMSSIRYNGGKFVSVFVATKSNIPDLYNTIKMAFAFGANGMMLNRFNVGGRGCHHMDSLMPSVELVRRMLTVADKAALEFDFPISCSIAIQPCLINIDAYSNLQFGFCAAGTNRAYYTLDPLGNLRPCNHTKVILGNVMEERFTDLIAPKRLSPFMDSIPDFCSPCTLRTICQGGCKAAAESCYGSLNLEEPFLKHNKEHSQPLSFQ